MDAATPKNITQPAYSSLLADHGFESIEDRGLTYPLGDYAPEYGEIFELMPGIKWTRTPVPGALGHINNYLLSDRDEQGEGLALVETGLFMPAVIDVWKGLFEGALSGERFTRILPTHFHPDHLGCAGWLCNRFKVRLWMSRTEWLMGRMLMAGQSNDVPKEALAQYKAWGWKEDQISAREKEGWGMFARACSDIPVGHVRIQDGDTIAIGDHDFDVMTGSGHSPEHVCLIDNDRHLIISGDQILPRITSNVGMMLSEPLADPLGEWLRSIDKFRAALDPELLVLPAHGRPFKGVHTRLDQLKERHEEALDKLEAALADGPMQTVDAFPYLFARPVGDSVYGLASSEAAANFRHLEMSGRVQAEDRNGVIWYHSA